MDEKFSIIMEKLPNPSYTPCQLTMGTNFFPEVS